MKPWDKVTLNGVEFPKCLPDTDKTEKRVLFERLIKSQINLPLLFNATGLLPPTYTIKTECLELGFVVGCGV